MNLIKSTGTFSFFTIISRLLGYLRDILIAIFLGTSYLADVFFVAFRIPNTFRRLFSEGTFNAAFVPSYSSLLKKKKQSEDFANNIYSLLILGLFFLREPLHQENKLKPNLFLLSYFLTLQSLACQVFCDYEILKLLYQYNDLF